MSNSMRASGEYVEPFLIPSEEEGASPFSMIHFCNQCGHSMKDLRSFILEYWRSDQTVYFCWCHSCGHRWELVEIKTITTMELDEEDEGF
ncbi:hypothetical protein CVD25_21805 [Bacillus canaveralius]|uniref:Uncharacterized protein n=1 Tax=Bacillus canaveralius TaxID=1403243 RepID=A0A2N5GFL3_9BACI|nr:MULTISPECIES: hypothetical protein [Bacillus]PLR79536.1 hypothetical protein CU635_22725 [Bacillus canaveralius]PLR86229.1 hypothetical protein CVD23_07315 [Bacillus sp. V33-4]PLR89069.1 hypothetical protein CVD25_21805 [Bacillus canaveralius]